MEQRLLMYRKRHMKTYLFHHCGWKQVCLISLGIIQQPICCIWDLSNIQQMIIINSLSLGNTTWAYKWPNTYNVQRLKAFVLDGWSKGGQDFQPTIETMERILETSFPKEEEKNRKYFYINCIIARCKHEHSLFFREVKKRPKIWLYHHHTQV